MSHCSLRNPGKMTSSGRAMQGLSGDPDDPRFPKEGWEPLLPISLDLRAGDEAKARLELRARECWEPGWKRTRLNVRV